MSVPGSNLLNKALSVISRQSFQYLAFASRTPNAIGQDVTTYATPVTASGSVQPVPRSLFYNLGLDLQKNYFNFFLAKNVIDIARDVSGDQFVFNGRLFQCLSKTDWYMIDGWDQVLTVEIEPYSS